MAFSELIFPTANDVYGSGSAGDGNVLAEASLAALWAKNMGEVHNYTISGAAASVPGSGLSLTIPTGEHWIEGYYIDTGGSDTVAVTNNATTYTYMTLDRDGSNNVTGVSLVNTATLGDCFGTDCLPLYTVTASAGNITAIYDLKRSRGWNVNDQYREYYRALGGDMIGATMLPQDNDNGGSLPGDQWCVFTALWLPKGQTITGLEYALQQQGVYTADNNNKIGLYECDGVKLTLVASCANDGNLWKIAVDTNTRKAFSATYDTIYDGIYYAAMLYNNSAQTTAPKLYGYDASTAGDVASSFGIGSTGAVLSGRLTGQSDLPSSTTLAGLTTSTCRPCMFGAY